MNAQTTWSTSCFGHDTDTLPGELSVLHDHLHLCRDDSPTLTLLQRAGEMLHGALCARVVTTLVVATAVMGAVLLML